MELNEAGLPKNPWWKGRGSNFWTVQAYAQGQQDMLKAGFRKVPNEDSFYIDMELQKCGDLEVELVPWAWEKVADAPSGQGWLQFIPRR